MYPEGAATMDRSKLTDAEFDERLRQRVREGTPMTAEQRREQRINYVYGERVGRTKLSREQIAQIVDQA